MSGQGCAAGLVRYGDPALGCDDTPAVRVYYEATLDYAGVSLVDEGESSAGLVVSGRFLASVRAPGEPTPSATWRGDVPDDGTASISSVSIYRTGGGGSLSQEARKL